MGVKHTEGIAVNVPYAQSTNDWHSCTRDSALVTLTDYCQSDSSILRGSSWVVVYCNFFSTSTETAFWHQIPSAYSKWHFSFLFQHFQLTNYTRLLNLNAAPEKVKLMVWILHFHWLTEKPRVRERVEGIGERKGSCLVRTSM